MNRSFEKTSPFFHLLFGIFVFLATGISVIGFLYYRAERREALSMRQNELTAIADLKVQSITHWRRENLEHTGQLSYDQPVARQVARILAKRHDSAERKELIQWLKSMVDHGERTSAMVLDTSGKVRIWIPGSDSVPGSASRHRLPHVIRSRQTELTDLYKAGPSDSERLDILTPLVVCEQGDSIVVGVMLFKTDPQEFLFPMVQSWPTLSKTAETLLIRRDGDSVVFLNELRHRKSTVLNLRFPLTELRIPAVQAVLGREGIFEGSDYRGVPVLAVLKRIPDSPWFLVAKVDIEEIESSMRQMAFAVWLSVLLFILVAALAAAVIWRNARAGFFQRLYQAESERQASEKRYLSLFENMSEGFAYCKMIFDKGVAVDWVYVAVNNAFETLTGLRNVTGKRVSEVIPGIRQSDPRLFETYGDVALNGTPQKFEILVEAMHMWFSISVYCPEKEHFVAVFEVITERKKAEQAIRDLNINLEERVRERTARLVAANKELESFSYSVSHDLRAPLRSLDGFSQALLEDYEDKLDDKGKDYLHRVRRSTQHMGTLIDDMINLSRVTRQTMNVEETDLSRMAEEFAAELRKSDGNRRTTFEIAPALKAHCDGRLLRIVMENLMGNSWKFTAKHPEARIEFGMMPKEGRPVFFIRDDGAGFDMTYAGKLFGAFQRLHLTAEFPGTGIGLATVQRIINRHGGQVWGEGAVEKGATFYFTLG